MSNFFCRFTIIEKENDALASTFIFNMVIFQCYLKNTKYIGGHMSNEFILKSEILTQVDINLGESHALYKASIGKIRLNFDQIGIQRKRQRKYLFDDIPGGPGHKWQRQLFQSLLVGIPIGEFMFTVMEIENKESETSDTVQVFLNEDGQQRMYTTMAIVDNKVKLPETIPYQGYEQYGGRLFSQLPLNLRETIFNTEWPIKVSFLKDEHSRYDEFVKANDGNPLSAQDLRSGQPTEGASYIQSLVDGDNEIKFGNYSGMTYPKFEMFQVQVLNGKCSHTYAEIDPSGRSMEEITANWFSWIRYGGLKEMSSARLDQMYSEFNTGLNPSPKEKIVFEKLLKRVNSVLIKNKSRKGLTKKPLDYLLPVIQMFIDNNVKIDDTTFIKQYLGAISKLKQENKTWVPKKGKNGKKTVAQKFDYVWRQLTTNEAIQYLINQVYKTMISKMKSDGAFNVVDSNREFNDDQKRYKLMDQDYKCGYCGTDIDLHDSHGDHILPHSKGGKTEIDNLVMSCPKCNMSKKDKTPEEWESVSYNVTRKAA